MLFRVDHSSPRSLADQLEAQVRTAVADGSLAAGDRLPPARELADSLGINMHTVLRAYGALRDDGLLQMRRGRGAWIAESAGPGLVRVTTLVEQLLAEARRSGISPADLVRLIERTTP
ncbi:MULTISPECIES: GntR family transcriptional regulator [unclassified Rathayibacter]|uniref:GntR family transcriptional regulator n=1 Tax=unclassified Rathayibacter TaxID=2609250 RepID=UPI0006FBE8E8|nr:MULTISPECIES: GntR family transcriptional regulator [unclassified Rathayibacter]KQQ05517.1 GntR family transcriptional regulator [Rathayibacter sp. Leaf294]KQS13379.1 GntR family transcriptional regulator [Rathayibacter sp. Leaf185]